MDSKERVRVALGHAEPDRVPMDILATPEVWGALKAHFGVGTEDEVRAELGTDFRYVGPKYTGPELASFEDGSYETIWGSRRTPVDYGMGHYDEFTYLPLADAKTLDDVAAHRWPSPDWYDYDSVRSGAAGCEGFAVVSGGMGVPDFINGAAFMRGMEQVLLDLATEDPVVFDMFDRRSAFFVESQRREYEAAGGLLDVAWFGDDYGTQRGLTISPETFRKHFAPRWKAHLQIAKEHGLTTMLHSCGSTRDIIPDLIELGFDVLETLQPEAAGMDPAELKSEFGASLAFHGMISSQGVLPTGSPQDVREEVRRTLDIMAPGGGYVLAPTHNIQPDSPVANIVAMYEEGREYGAYG